MGRGRPSSAACVLFLVRALAGSGAAALRRLGKPSQDAHAGRSYILHNPCPSTEGIGSSLKFLKPVIEVAQSQNLTYVCQAKDFRSHGHHTGNLGYLWGCYNDSYVLGDLAAYDEVQAKADLTHVNAKIAQVAKAKATLYNPKDVMSKKVNGTALPIQPKTLYYVDQPGLFYFSWGVAYKWFRSQYHLVRQHDKARRGWRCGKTPLEEEGERKRIVLQIRRGDANLKTPMQAYAQMLDMAFDGKISGISLNVTNAHIIIISEADEGSADFDLFKKFSHAKVTYLLGGAEVEQTRAQSRLVRDLDCMSSADLLILSRGGFSSLAAALQKDGGVSLSIDADPVARPDVPNVRAIEVEDLARKKKREEREQRDKEMKEQRRREKEEKERAEADRANKKAPSRLSSDTSALGLHGQYSLRSHYDGLPNAFVINLAEEPQGLY